MEIISEFLTNYGGEIILGVVTTVFGFIGTAIKNIVKQWANNKEKREIVKDVVRSVEQIYTTIHGSEKLHKAIETASEILHEKGIPVTELELMTLIESAVAEFNDAFNKSSWKEGIETVAYSENN